MLAQAFEIKLGLMGHVSVGKTTGLNALFQGKFSEVGMKRTTAGINFFRVSSIAKRAKRPNTSPGIEDDATMDWQDIDDESGFREAKKTLKAIANDNARLRTTNELQERTFEIELDEPLLEDMHDDTNLVIVDIPGVNEAGTRKLYRDYVERTWDSYDAIIVVMVSS